MKIRDDNTFLDKICVLVLFWGVVFTDILYLAHICAANPYETDFNAAFSHAGWYILLHFAIILVAFSFTLIFSPKGAKLYAFIFAFFFSLLSLIYVAYYRFFNTLPSLSMTSLINFSNGDVPSDPANMMIPLKVEDVFFFLSIFIFIIVNRLAKLFKVDQLPLIKEPNKKVKKSTAICHKTYMPHLVQKNGVKLNYIVVAIISIVTIVTIPVTNAIISSSQEAQAKTFVEDTIAYTPLGGFLGDINSVLTPKKQLSQKQIDDIKKYFKWNASLYKESEYFGALKGKNIIYVQLEAFENFVINLKIDGKEVTPNLNRLIEKGYYFPNVHDQVRSGNSSDCDFISSTSILPGNRKVGMKDFADNTFNSLPNILEKEGYNTSYYSSTANSNWGYDKGIPGIGYDNYIEDYIRNEDTLLNTYMSDQSYFEQTLAKITTGQGSFLNGELQLAHLVCCSSHAPFQLPKDCIYFDVPTDLKDTVLGRYIEAVNYTDTQIGIFIDQLEQSGILQNSVVIFCGDHLGPHKYYPKEMKQFTATYLQGVKDNYDETVPLIIYSGAEDVVPKTFTQHAGQVDVMPTILDLMGVKHDVYKNTAMGRSLVSTNVDFAVGAKGKIFGNPDKEAKKQLKKSLKIADLILEYDYFKQKNDK